MKGDDKMTLWKLLNSSEVKNFDLKKKLKICTISSASMVDRLMADVEEYLIDEIPYRLLGKEVFSVYSFENVIEVFK
ncbi:MAG TPA: hypothetical protein VIL26_03740 [Clostridia bacterium]